MTERILTPGSALLLDAGGCGAASKGYCPNSITYSITPHDPFCFGVLVCFVVGFVGFVVVSVGLAGALSTLSPLFFRAPTNHQSNTQQMNKTNSN